MHPVLAISGDGHVLGAALGYRLRAQVTPALAVAGRHTLRDGIGCADRRRGWDREGSLLDRPCPLCLVAPWMPLRTLVRIAPESLTYQQVQNRNKRFVHCQETAKSKHAQLVL